MIIVTYSTRMYAMENDVAIYDKYFKWSHLICFDVLSHLAK